MTGNLWAAIRQSYDSGLLSGAGLNITGGKVWYVSPQTGSVGASGDSWDRAAVTMSDISSKLLSGDVILLRGVLREQWIAPQDIFEVSIIGAANQPRQATDSGTPTGGGASWLSPTSPTATTPLLKLREQGWAIKNIQFAPVASSACIRLSGAETAADADASHTIIENCYFSAGGSGGIGIEDVGGRKGVNVVDCRFEGLAKAITTISTGVRVPNFWQILRNIFRENTMDIACSLNYSLIKENVFMTAGSGSTNKVISTTFVTAQGGHNTILWNVLNNTEAQIAPASGFTGASTDFWMNYVSDQAALAIGQPA